MGHTEWKLCDYDERQRTIPKAIGSISVEAGRPSKFFLHPDVGCAPAKRPATVWRGSSKPAAP